jgi:hypothetical protein
MSNATGALRPPSLGKLAADDASPLRSISFDNRVSFNPEEHQNIPGLIRQVASLIPYSEMARLHMGSQTWLVLNSDRVVSELIAKRGKITNERPHMPGASDFVSNGKRTV